MPSSSLIPQRAQVGLGIVVTIGLRALVGDAERLSARHDRDAVHRIRPGHHQPEDGVAALVIGDALAVFAAEQQRALRAEYDLLQRVEEVLLAHLVLLAPRGEQRRLVGEVLEVGAGEAGRGGGQLGQVDVL